MLTRIKLSTNVLRDMHFSVLSPYLPPRSTAYAAVDQQRLRLLAVHLYPHASTADAYVYERFDRDYATALACGLYWKRQPRERNGFRYPLCTMSF